MKFLILMLMACVSALPFTNTARAADVELWRLDCGRIEVRDLSFFSDSFAYGGKKRSLTDSCYLVRHDTQYMLWDAGLPASLIGAKPDEKSAVAPSLSVDISSQLARIGVKPDQIALIGISHNHFDHVGQANSFPGARLLIGKADFDALKTSPPPFGVEPTLLSSWLEGKAEVTPVTADYDVFGDGSVTMLKMPGHTPGETSLLVRLPKTGPVILSGDVVHFHEQFARRGVPPFNADRSDSLASMDRLSAIAVELGARIIIQHDETNIGKLPAFSKSAR
ncbi:N-acyl homoserine lactonase family protein [Nordella sp. HKS 07]|uniref:N-acyl homoserine lactonase family protein n=1 Tax=Nordella sp. HKS 07 TaxID=2712222 RepID=UPI001FEE6211|nr:N-acyl homoserine lactonase family protein [Nordella sp. HKS 07]